MTLRFGILKMTATALTATCLLVGCSSAQGLNAIHVGMTKQEVISVLGSPTSSSAQGGAEILGYNLYSGFFSPVWYQNYYVQLVQGEVVSYGQ
jgi:hypothetical protein